MTAPAPHDSTISLSVVERAVVAHDQDVVMLTFAGADRAPLPPWRPGAHLDIHLPSGRVRQYWRCAATQLSADSGYRDRGAAHSRWRRRRRPKCTKS